MDTESILQLLLLFVLLIISAFLTSAETALTSINKLNIKSLINLKNKRASIVGKIIENPEKMLSAILICNIIVILIAAVFVIFFVQDYYGEATTNDTIFAAIGVLALILLLFGKIIPRSIASLHAQSISLHFAYTINAIIWILTPIIFIINKISGAILKIFRIDYRKKANTITETELRSIVDISHEEGVIEKEEREMIKNLFDFTDAMAKDVMVPRINMTSVSIDCTYEELIEIFRRDRYTRIPVFKDSSDNVVGIINMKDILLYEPSKIFNISDFLREPYYTYEYKNLFELMLEMKKASINCIIVLDEYGATAGLITLEDLLEEIVGEIRDEYDFDEEDEIAKISDTEYIVEGRLKIDDLNDLLEVELETVDYDTIGGFIMEKLDRLPEVGDTVSENGLLLIVESIEKNRINKVRITIQKIQK